MEDEEMVVGDHEMNGKLVDILNQPLLDSISLLS